MTDATTPRPWTHSTKRGPHGWVVLDATGDAFAETNTKAQAVEICNFANAHDRLQAEHKAVGSVAGLLNAAETFDLDAFNYIEPDEGADWDQLWSILLETRQWLREVIRVVKEVRGE